MFFRMTLCALLLITAVAQANEQKPQTENGQQTSQSIQSSSNQQEPQTAEQAPPSSASLEAANKQIDGVKLRAIEANLVSYTNEERVRYGLQPLQVDEELMETAREHAGWMTRMRSMVHTWRAVAENIAMGQPHSSDAVRAWMNSSGHRANILNSGHRRIGVAAFRTEGGTIFWCQQFRP